MEIFDTGTNYQNADNCKQCPKRNDEQGCPSWWEWVETNNAGQERLRKSCGKQSMQVFMVEVIKASNRPAAAVEDTRNEIVKGFDRLAGIAGFAAMKNIGADLKPARKGIYTKLKKMLGG